MANEIMQSERKFTDEELSLITSTVAKGATPKELELFLYRCKSVGLDPLKPGRIHFIKYGNSAGTVVIGIDGFRTIAHRSGKLAGIKRGVLKDGKGDLIGAWAEVYRTDWKEPAREEVSRKEYDTGNSTWKKLPETMLKKVAEAAALRMAFPDDLGGVYESAEMDQAAVGKVASNAPGIFIEQPAEGEFAEVEQGVGAEWRFPGGKHNTKKLKEFTIKDVETYTDNTEAYFKKLGKPNPIWWNEYLKNADIYCHLVEPVTPQPVSKFNMAQEQLHTDVSGDFFASAPS